VIILNSSPVIHLTAALGGLELLPSLYGRVLVPRELHQELEAGAHLDDAGPRLRAATGVEIITLAGGISPLLTDELDIGEAAVIQLAIDRPGATVVLDDLKARRVAPGCYLLGRDLRDVEIFNLHDFPPIKNPY